ncbi:D-serine ammonia-lyase [Oleidesulfovibrio sp.]|uniref:D-serine ammonia-lyase n=1 Tax=Oleidesulfovibrio sp. TaxID=2909707 RepID=UPI003A868EE3
MSTTCNKNPLLKREPVKAPTLLSDGSSLRQWLEDVPILQVVAKGRPAVWQNPDILPMPQAIEQGNYSLLPHLRISEADVDEAEARLERFAPFIASVFPGTAKAHGIIESPLLSASQMAAALNDTQPGYPIRGSLWCKLDSHLPVSGSVKARGGIHEVLAHAERLAIRHNILTPDRDYRELASDRFRQFFSGYSLAVGSTGNLGLSIGIMGRALGFSVTVHMSAEAKQWKKELLRKVGATVVEHNEDYGKAVAEGRKAAEQDTRCHFVDDERSRDLFTGYAVTARRLKPQLEAAGIMPDERAPLAIYLPCGVGGGPGGITYGLKQAFGDAVRCVFVEPVQAPCMLLGLATRLHDAVSVQDFNLTGKTAADGLAVGRPSALVGKLMAHAIDAVCTVDDETLYQHIAMLDQAEGIRIEPSAAAGFSCPARMEAIDPWFYGANHLVWTTGGSMVPADEMEGYLAAGKALLQLQS